MAKISAALVKELRERTGSGMMECKKALVETDGNIETAIEVMRKKGLAKADKRSGKIAAEGLAYTKFNDDRSQGIVIEVNCETDFVAKGDDFQGFVDQVAGIALANKLSSVEELLAMPYGDADSDSIDVVRQQLIARIGENINIRRMSLYASKPGALCSYRHGEKIAVLVDVEGADEALGKDIAMHIAASRPTCVTADQVPKDLLSKEREIFSAQAKDSGKPDNIVEKMVEGRIRKYLAEITLEGQAFIKDPDQTVAKMLKAKGATVNAFTRLEVGEGIEKKVENFAEEVMAQAKSSS